MIPRLALLLELAKHHARGPERPKPGGQPARIHYFTVSTASGKRCCSIDLQKRGGQVQACRRRLTGDEGSHEQHT